MPRVLVDVSNIDVSTQLLGEDTIHTTALQLSLHFLHCYLIRKEILKLLQRLMQPAQDCPDSSQELLSRLISCIYS